MLYCFSFAVASQVMKLTPISQMDPRHVTGFSHPHYGRGVGVKGFVEAVDECILSLERRFQADDRVLTD